MDKQNQTTNYKLRMPGIQKTDTIERCTAKTKTTTPTNFQFCQSFGQDHCCEYRVQGNCQSKAVLSPGLSFQQQSPHRYNQ